MHYVTKTQVRPLAQSVERVVITSLIASSNLTVIQLFFHYFLAAGLASAACLTRWCAIEFGSCCLLGGRPGGKVGSCCLLVGAKTTP